MPFRKNADPHTALADACPAEWADFAKYCSLRASGLRPQALSAAREFVARFEELPLNERVDFAKWIGSAGRTLIPHPLLVALRATTNEWSAMEPSSAEAHFWTAVYAEPISGAGIGQHFRRALELDPHFRPARERVFSGLLDAVEYNQHHMPQSYINNPADDLRTLDEASALIDMHPDDMWRARGRRQVQELRRVALRAMSR
jgi:hypothetical protein